MKKILSIFLATILLTFGYSTNHEVFATTLKQEKQEIINELKNLKKESDREKTKKSIDAAIQQIKKSLEDKLWKDDSTLNIKPGKKVLSTDQKAVNKLDNILKDKKESDSIKEKISDINQRIAEVDGELVENAIESIEDVVMSKKGLKKIDKASKNLEKGEEFLEDGKHLKAIKNFVKAWDQIKKALKDPHFKKMKIVELEGTGDMNFDGIPDVYLKVVEPNKKNKPKQVEMKITGDCVNGEIHEDATMKIGFSTQMQLSTEFFKDKVTASNKWFKKYDINKKIDPVVISTTSEYFSFPLSGDDLIQRNAEGESFKFISTPIPEIGNQTGWKGKFHFDGEPGNYNLNFFFPLTEPTNQGDSCNFVSSFSINTTILP